MTIQAKHVALVLVFIGVIISGYLSYTKLLDVPIICTEGESFSCEAVQESSWSAIAGIPVAYLGFASYIVIGALFLLEDRIEFLADNGLILIFTIVLIGWLFSMWLVYIQAVVILAFCQWCLAHELNFTLLFAVVLYMLWREFRD